MAETKLGFLEIAKKLVQPSVSNDLGLMDEFLFQSNDIHSRLDGEDITNLRIDHINQDGFNVRVSFVSKGAIIKLKCVYTEISICKKNRIRIKIGKSAFIFSVPEDLINEIRPFVKSKDSTCSDTSAEIREIEPIMEGIMGYNKDTDKSRMLTIMRTYS